MSGGFIKRAARRQGISVLAIGACAVGVSVAASAPGPVLSPSGSIGIPRVDASSTAGELGGCRITLLSAVADADGMPRLGAELPFKEVQRQRGDSVLVNATLRFDNTNDRDQYLKLDGFVRDAKQAEHVVNWRDAATGQKWSGWIGAGREEIVVFYARVSPPVAGPVTLLVRLKDESGRALWLRSAQLPVIVAR